MEFAWLKEWAGQGIAVVVCLILLWFAFRGGRAVWLYVTKFIDEKLWPKAEQHVDTVNTTLDKMATNEIRQTLLMDSMKCCIDLHTQILDKHTAKLDEHGQKLHEIHQWVRKPANGGG